MLYGSLEHLVESAMAICKALDCQIGQVVQRVYLARLGISRIYTYVSIHQLTSLV